ncbi:hypothetical protein D3C78_815930 [compost metagenome]
MFRDVGRCAPVFAAKRQTLQQAQGDQDDRRGHADGRVAGQQADHGRRYTHDHDGDEEGVLAPDHVAEPAEHDGAEGPYGEACGECEQGEDEGGGFVHAGEEVLCDDRGERAVEIEVIPFEYGSEGGGEDHLALFPRDPAVGGCALVQAVEFRHVSSPSCYFAWPEYHRYRTQAVGRVSVGLRISVSEISGRTVGDAPALNCSKARSGL